MTKMRFAVRIPGIGPAASVQRLTQITLEAEALGFDAIVLPDHIHKSFEKHRSSPPASGSLQDPSNTSDPVHYETVSTLSYLAGKTSRIQLLVGVMALPLRDARVLAKELATLDVLSGGRFILGVGVSNVTDKPEYEALGIPFRPYAERYAQIGEQVAAMRAIWESSSATFHGTYVDFQDLTIYPKPERRIPVWIGCGSLSKGPGHPAVDFTLAHADGWLFPFLADPDQVADLIRDFKAIAAAAGRDLAGFEYCIQRRISLGATEAEAHENIDWVLTEQTDMWKWAGYLHAQGEAGFQTAVANVSIGTPDQLVALIERYAASGATMMEVVPSFDTYDQLLRQLRLFGTEVLPAFR